MIAAFVTTKAGGDTTAPSTGTRIDVLLTDPARFGVLEYIKVGVSMCQHLACVPHNVQFKCVNLGLTELSDSWVVTIHPSLMTGAISAVRSVGPVLLLDLGGKFSCKSAQGHGGKTSRW